MMHLTAFLVNPQLAAAASCFAAVSLGTLVSMFVQRCVSALCPNSQLLCRWVLLASLLAGSVAGGGSQVLGVFSAVTMGQAVAVGCGMFLCAQMAGWLLFLCWMLNGLIVISTDQCTMPATPALYPTGR